MDLYKLSRFFPIPGNKNLIKKGPGEISQTLDILAGTTRLELATSGVTGRTRAYYA